jgi:hypothetical protein
MEATKQYYLVSFFLVKYKQYNIMHLLFILMRVNIYIFTLFSLNYGIATLDYLCSLHIVF